MKHSTVVFDANAVSAPERYRRRLVLFDFDGTITTRDTLAEFIRFYRGSSAYLAGLFALAPTLTQYVLGLTPNAKAKEKLMTWFFGGENLVHFDAQCNRFAREIVPKLVRPAALEEIRRHQQEGAVVAVVSASAENWVRPWCEIHSLQCLATRLEAAGGKLTGKFSGKNCYGDEKVCRIRTAFDTTDFDEIIAYGDSSGDREMLALAHTAYYKPFRNSQ